MQYRKFGAAILVAAVVTTTVSVARAQSGTVNYYLPPKIIKIGSTKTPVAGNGTVVVKVFVNADGTFKVDSVIRATPNHDNDAAALEVARSSSYRPATRGKKPVAAFYDFTIKFSGGTASTGDGDGLAKYELMIRAGNYDGAKKGLTDYVAAHPTDQKAQTDLGVALTFLNEFEGATKAFDSGGTIPPNYRAVAGKAYAEFAAVEVAAKNYPAAVASAKKSVELSPGMATYNALGYGELAAGDAAAAAKDLEQAHSLAASSNAPAKQRALIAGNLVAAYLDLGDPVKAKTFADEAVKLDPSAPGPGAAFVNYYAKQAGEKGKAGKHVEAAGYFEQAGDAAKAMPNLKSAAASMYANAAFAYLSIQPKPDNAKARADAEKALGLDPASPTANFAIGIALANDGKNKDALEALNKALAGAKAANDAALTAKVEGAIKQISPAK